jgi:hypothetical protein
MSLLYSSSTRISIPMLLIMMMMMMTTMMMMVRSEVVPSNTAELLEDLFDSEDVARDKRIQAPVYSPAYFRSIDIKSRALPRCRPERRKCGKQGDECSICIIPGCCKGFKCVAKEAANPFERGKCKKQMKKMKKRDKKTPKPSSSSSATPVIQT